MEYRAHTGTVELRQSQEGSPIISGYAAVFNRDSENLGGFIEQVDPSAFTKTVSESDVRALGNHEPSFLLGRSKAGTLRLITDSLGLRYEIDVNTQDPDGQRALAKVQRGDWAGSSFSFQVLRDEWNWEAEPAQRRLLEVQVFDVGPVTFPAYPDTTATARNALQRIADRCKRPVEELVSALKAGEIRSIVNGKVEERAAGATTLVWAPEDGFMDRLKDIEDVLNGEGDWRYCGLDLSVAFDQALIANYRDNDYYIVPVTFDANNEPTVAPSSEWVSVEQGWVTSDDERALRSIARAKRKGIELGEEGKGLALASAMQRLQLREREQKLLSAA